jgi:hypothetical protein
MIRPAALHDFSAIFELAVAETAKYEDLRMDESKIRKGIVQSISSANHFAWVAQNNGKVDGAIIGLTSENLWAQRKNCIVALWKATVPGDGAALLREFKDWVQSRRAIRVAGLVPDSDHLDARAYMLAGRIGFKSSGGIHLLYN